MTDTWKMTSRERNGPLGRMGYEAELYNNKTGDKYKEYSFESKKDAEENVIQKAKIERNLGK